jgi:hypothetical protein
VVVVVAVVAVVMVAVAATATAVAVAAGGGGGGVWWRSQHHIVTAPVTDFRKFATVLGASPPGDHPPVCAKRERKRLWTSSDSRLRCPAVAGACVMHRYLQELHPLHLGFDKDFYSEAKFQRGRVHSSDDLDLELWLANTHTDANATGGDASSATMVALKSTMTASPAMGRSLSATVRSHASAAAFDTRRAISDGAPSLLSSSWSLSSSSSSSSSYLVREKMYKDSCQAVERFCLCIGQPPTEALDLVMRIVHAIHKEVCAGAQVSTVGGISHWHVGGAPHIKKTGRRVRNLRFLALALLDALLVCACVSMGV